MCMSGKLPPDLTAIMDRIIPDSWEEDNDLFCTRAGRSSGLKNSPVSGNLAFVYGDRNTSKAGARGSGAASTMARPLKKERP